MLDMQFVRNNPDIVKENEKFQDEKLSLVDEVIEFDKEARAAKQEAGRSSRRRGTPYQSRYRRAYGSGKKGRGRRSEEEGYGKIRAFCFFLKRKRQGFRKR